MQKLEDNASEPPPSRRAQHPRKRISGGCPYLRSMRNPRWENYHSLKLTASLPLKMGWLGDELLSFGGLRPIFRGELLVSFRECINPSGCRNFKKNSWTLGWQFHTQTNADAKKVKEWYYPRLETASCPFQKGMFESMRWDMLPSSKLTYPLKIGLPKRKGLSSNHPFSGASSRCIQDLHRKEGSHPWL